MYYLLQANEALTVAVPNQGHSASALLTPVYSWSACFQTETALVCVLCVCIT